MTSPQSDTLRGPREVIGQSGTLRHLNPSAEGEGLKFSGYAALWDRVDRAGDVFRDGAFGAGEVALLWQHRGEPVGKVAVAPDARGLRVEGEVSDPALAKLVRAGAVDGLSVGYRPHAVRQGAWREISAAELIEVSLVAVPMQPAARVTAID